MPRIRIYAVKRYQRFLRLNYVNELNVTFLEDGTQLRIAEHRRHEMFFIFSVLFPTSYKSGLGQELEAAVTG